MRRPPCLPACLTITCALAAAGCAAPDVPGLGPGQLARLQHGEWRVVAIDGQPPAGEVTLQLGADGRLRGRAGCNGFTGSYSVIGDRFQPVAVASTAPPELAVGPLASTRRACAQALMADERRFLALLERANALAMDEAGAHLQVMSPPAHRIDARRP